MEHPRDKWVFRKENLKEKNKEKKHKKNRFIKNLSNSDSKDRHDSVSTHRGFYQNSGIIYLSSTKQSFKVYDCQGKNIGICRRTHILELLKGERENVPLVTYVKPNEKKESLPITTNTNFSVELTK